MNYLICDLETEAEEYLGRKGSAWKNPILAISMSNGQEQYTEYLKQQMVDFLIDEDIFVAFNAKFEMSYFWKFKGFQKFVLEGGKIFDPQLFEYMKSGFIYKYPSLRDVAVNLYKQPERVKWIEYYLFDKKNTIKNLEKAFTEEDHTDDIIYNVQEEINFIESIISMQDIPKDKVLEDVRQDVKDTETVFLSEYRYITDNGLINISDVFMDSLLATTEMEMNGFKVDREFLVQQNNNLINEIEAQKISLQNIVNKYWSFPISFNPNSGVHIGILLYGGELNIPEKQAVVDSNGELVRCKNGNIKLRVQPHTHILNGFGLESVIKTKAGKPSTSKSTLEIIAKRNPTNALEKDAVNFCKLLLDTRINTKDNKTYFQGIIESIYPDGCVRAQYQHVRTATARLSCKNPNLQNLTGKDY